MRWLGNVYQDKGDMNSAHKWRLQAQWRAEQPDAQIPDDSWMTLKGDLGGGLSRSP